MFVAEKRYLSVLGKMVELGRPTQPMAQGKTIRSRLSGVVSLQKGKLNKTAFVIMPKKM